MRKTGTAKLTLTVSKPMKELLQTYAAAGNFASTGDFVSDLMNEKLLAQEKSRLAQLLKEGLVSGKKKVTGSAYWKDLERRAMQQSSSGRKEDPGKK